MESQNLKAFVTVAEHQSFSRAAELLHITQPAVSKRISTLENELDTLLFDRIGRQPQLTEAGYALLPRARAILLQLDDAERALTNLNGEVTGRLSIGTSHHIGLHRLAPVLREFTQKYPQVQLDIRFLDSEEGCYMVETGTLELAMVTLPSSPSPKLLTEQIWDDPLAIVMGPNHPLAQHKPPLTLAMLSEHNAILPAKGTFTRNIIERASAEMGTQLQVSLETNYLETIKMMVSIGLGWSALPTNMIDGDLISADVKGLNIRRGLGTVIHRERTLSNAASHLMKVLDAYRTK
ncbi:transcriptional regulator, LysR family [gamma proteobacterium HTCC5015]|nr:transcriptional regulator, LysR family [gamma proteobacterium HTCC5015]